MWRLAMLCLAGWACVLRGQEPPPDFEQVSKFLEAVQKKDSSEKSVGEFRLGQFAK